MPLVTRQATRRKDKTAFVVEILLAVESPFTFVYWNLTRSKGRAHEIVWKMGISIRELTIGTTGMLNFTLTD